jgi:hypothetical protein
MSSVIVCILAGCLHFTEANACEGTSVRDAAFNEMRDMHHLYVIGDSREPETQAIFDRLENQLTYDPETFNVLLRRIDAENPDIQWDDYGMPGPPPSLPVVALIGTNYARGGRFFIDYWNPELSADDLQIVMRSPLRDALLDEIGNRVAILLYAPATEGDASRADEIVQNTIDRWADKNELGFSMLQLDRHDPRERLLHHFVGLPESGPAWVAVMFGRGKVMPSLEGADITPENLDECLGILLEDCTCISSPKLLGVDMPLIWDAALDVLVKAAVLPDDAVAEVGADVVSGSMWMLGLLVSIVVVAAVVVVRRRS